MIRRLALGLAITAVAINPTAALDPFRDARPSIPRQVVAHEPTPAQIKAGLAFAEVVLSSPMWHRMIDTLNMPADHSRPCPYQRMIEHFFPDWPDAVAVAWRESRCQPAADNPTSTAYGLMQLLHSLHAHRYYSSGACTAADWHVPWCNLAAARHLYNEAGTSPWRLR